MANRGLVVLSHGLESGPQATKVSALAEVCAELGWESVRPDYRALDRGIDQETVEGRLARLLDHAAGARRLVLAGSSLGAYVSALASRRLPVEGLFLIAPPVELPGVALVFDPAPVPTMIVHGWQDELIPAAAVIAFARDRRAGLALLDDDHRLHRQVPIISALFREFLRTLG